MSKVPRTPNLSTATADGRGDGERLPGRRVFIMLVGLMLLVGLLFVVFFLACLVLVLGRRDGASGGRAGEGTLVDSLEARLFGPRAVQNNGNRRAGTLDGIRAALSADRVGPAPGPRANAVVLVLSRNRELRALLDTLRQFEERFNRRFGYPYVFLNDQPFTAEFVYGVRQVLGRGRRVAFGRIPAEHWSLPAHIDRERVKASLEGLRSVIHGASLSYRHMCRWFSGFFFEHGLLKKYDWFWRIEPGVSFPCDIVKDPFREMETAGQSLGFAIAMSEIMETIPGLWNATLAFQQQSGVARPSSKNSLLDYFTYTDPDGRLQYNGCHFWNNFEIGRLSFFRSPAYRAYFRWLDETGGFFYERWGDAPVHSLAAALLLRRDQVRHFDQIGYRHEPAAWCPEDAVLRRQLLCTCDPYDRGDASTNACMRLWSRFNSLDTGAND